MPGLIAEIAGACIAIFLISRLCLWLFSGSPKGHVGLVKLYIGTAVVAVPISLLGSLDGGSALRWDFAMLYVVAAAIMCAGNIAVQIGKASKAGKAA